MKYKLRAECSQDILNFLEKSGNQMMSFKMTREDLTFPDAEFEFETKLTLDEIILILKGIIDSHVMYQTVKPISEYTGERNYDLV